MGAAQVLGGRYRLVERLGQGGMSVVWLGYDEVLGRPVAVKVLTARFAAHALSADRIWVEAQAAARLSHPHVVGVYDYGESRSESAERVPYVVMELLSGRTLADRLKDGPLPVPAALLTCAQVASALAAAHACGLVHRDVKPSNIMLTPAGVKVMDFGLAAEAGAAAESVLDGEVLGTPAYLAPERLTTGEVAPASDVYGLGLLLYTAVTGGLPWRAETVSEMLAAHWYAEPAPLPSAIGLPRRVRTLYQRCLAKDPRERPTAQEVATGLAEATLRRRRGRFWAAFAVTSTAPPPDREAETSIVRAAVPVAATAEPANPNRWGAAALAGSAAVVVAALVGGLMVPVDEALLPGSPVPGIAAPDPAASPPVPGGSVTHPNAGESGLPGMPGPDDMVRVSTNEDANTPGTGTGTGGAAPEVSGPAAPDTGTDPVSSTPGPASPPPTGSEPSPDREPEPEPEPEPQPSPSPSPSPEPLVEQTVLTEAGPLVVQCVGSTVSLVSADLLPGFTVVDGGPGSTVSIGLLGQSVVVVRCQSGAPAVTLGLLAE
jgi:hypothetical protein